MAEWLAWISTRQNVDRLHRGPVDLGHVAQVGHVGPVVGEDLGRRLVELAEPRGGPAEDGLDAHLEAAVAAEQRPVTEGHCRSPPIRSPTSAAQSSTWRTNSADASRSSRSACHHATARPARAPAAIAAR